MLLPSIPPPKIMPRADFQPAEFVKQVYALGWRLTWQQAEECPCKEGEEHDSGRMGCPVCDGKGWAWHSAQEIRAIVTKAQQVIDPFDSTARSEWARGSINLTLLPEHLPGRLDRFEALDTVFLMREISRREGAGVSQLRYRIARRTLSLLTGNATLGVLRCRAEASSGVASTTVLVEGTHFDVTEQGDIDWTKGDALGLAPAVGKRFFVSYYAHPVFEAIEDGYSARDTRIAAKAATECHVPMLVQVSAKLKYGKVRV